MSDPLVPNYKRDVGRLATDRYDFEDHAQGNRFRHKAVQIDLNPAIVVDSNTIYDVQRALEALSTAVSPPVISDATTSSKGIIQLTGDISGVATNIIVTRIQGMPISSLTPSDGDVLTWDGTTNVWKPSPATNAFNAAGDLSGSNVLQNVVGLTGTLYDVGVGYVMRASNSVVNYDLNITPLITQQTESVNHGADFTIRAQNTVGVNKNGGNVVIAGGVPGTSGLRGGVKLQFSSGIPAGYPTTEVSGFVTSNMVQLAEPAAGRRVLSLCNSSDLSVIDMPSNTGDMVMYIRDTATPPSTGNPSNGTIMYSSGGQLWIKQQDGNNFSIGSIPNPSIWGSSGQQTYTSRNYVTSSIGAPGLAFSFNLPDNTATKIDVIFVGKESGANNSAQFNLSMGYSRHGAGPVAVGTVTNADARTTAGAATWVIPNISVSGNNLQIRTGYSGSVSINWLVITQLTMSS